MEAGHTSTVQLVLGHPQTPLHIKYEAIKLAGEYHNLEIIKLLLDDPKIDAEAFSPVLQSALTERKVDMIDLILKHPRVRNLFKDDDYDAITSREAQIIFD